MSDSKVPYKVFAATCGVKPDQLGGFESWILRNKTRTLSLEDWYSTYEAFLRRPVK